MAIQEHPSIGTILMCNFDMGFKKPEMVKTRPVVVISPKIARRYQLCTVVALSTTAPDPVLPFHRQINLRPRLPEPWDSDGIWIKGDMVNAVGFHRLDFIRAGKGPDGKRKYHYQALNNDLVTIIRQCVLNGIGLNLLTKHLT